MSPAAILLYLLVTLWLGTTLLAQFRLVLPLTSRLDGLHLIPRWTFFAPNPGVRDHHLVLRDRLADGRLTRWKSVPVYPARPRFAWLWNPHKRASKVLSDAIFALGFLLKKGYVDAAGVAFTVPYLVLLRYCAHAVPPEPGATQFQIAIVDSAGHTQRTLECSFLSRFHNR